ncbi:glycosyltransferase, partial [Klebsiella pneumoniae]|uniref:glycosyltransferase n=1 Tax=Klebsiella pneumoniae TaxID=573 RepID=UPI00272F4E8F
DNGGFSAAVNDGIRATESTYVVLLNNDTRADPGWLEALVAGMESQPEASMGASRMLLYDPPHAVDSAGDGFSLRAGA